MVDVSIIIINYNTKKMTIDCIKSIYRETQNISFEILVVDNASSDGSADAIEKDFPEVILIQSKENLGFARANNLAAEQAKGNFILLLNSDTVVLENAIEMLFHYAEINKDAGIFGGSTFNADGSRNPSSCWSKPTLWSTFCIASGLTSLFRNTKIFNPESFSWWDWSEPKEVDIISGCFMLMEKTLWNELKGFSPDFFMYGEDADLCLRAFKIDSPCVVYPEAKIIHYGGASESIHSEKMIKLFIGKNKFLYKQNISKEMIPYLFDLWALSRKFVYFFLKHIKKSYVQKSDSWNYIYKQKAEWHLNKN